MKRFFSIKEKLSGKVERHKWPFSHQEMRLLRWPLAASGFLLPFVAGFRDPCLHNFSCPSDPEEVGSMQKKRLLKQQRQLWQLRCQLCLNYAQDVDNRKHLLTQNMLHTMHESKSHITTYEKHCVQAKLEKAEHWDWNNHPEFMHTALDAFEKMVDTEDYPLYVSDHDDKIRFPHGSSNDWHMFALKSTFVDVLVDPGEIIKGINAPQLLIGQDGFEQMMETKDFPLYIIAHDDTTRFPKGSTNDWHMTALKSTFADIQVDPGQKIKGINTPQLLIGQLSPWCGLTINYQRNNPSKLGSGTILPNLAVATTDTVQSAISAIRNQAVTLLERQDIKGCWALLDELFPRNFFHRLKITAPYSGGKGKPRYNAKRLQHRPYTPKSVVFNSDHLTTETKEKICELEEEQRFQDYLAKEAAAKAASAREQTKVFYQLSNLERKQAEIDREKLELAHKYNDSLVTHAATSSVAVNTVLVTPPATPAKGRTDHFRRLFRQKETEKEKKDSEQQQKEKDEEEILLKEDTSMDIEIVV
ncbi:hypothetical protein DAPPUDRAFT_105210 [Daphnia pulex]|uniref:Uncharacterized protein n=1 Tax=Daphnia pulex TaxID=6669 RepID=E9GPS4_DAPPU|nr:hypothetical protein DAPPUDRAFT_105210 [Daphnia pulex]|eukprot:EFX78537.1 hypothetical protein DAPPUDRAFT_105210 [Daphnia pulex]